MTIQADTIREMSTEQLINGGVAERIMADCLMVPNSWLPENYRGKKKLRKLSSVCKQAIRQAPKRIKGDGRAESVKFDKDRNVTFARQERLATLERYAEQVQSGGRIEFDVNENREHGAMITFAGAMVQAGIMEEEDFME